MPLDRASHLRKNQQWLSDKISADSSCFYFFYQNKLLYLDKSLFSFSKAQYQGEAELLSLIERAEFNLIFLGLEQDKGHFVYDLSALNDDEINRWLAKLFHCLCCNDAKFIDFRHSISMLSQEQAAILGYAKALIHWQQSAVFCGTCGTETQSLDGGHRRQCLNSECQVEQFPRTDPAVIMLVEYQPKHGPALCLLAEHHRISGQVYSTLAGFVDPGESLVEAVHREVLEEVGIETKQITHFGSQPWPFPNSLMLGFFAQATDMEITLEEEELRSAAWFTAEQLQNFGEWGDETDGKKLPRKESISRRLIDTWCAKQLG